jgi:hypothetical protein
MARQDSTNRSRAVIDGMSFPTLEVGFAWSDPDAAIAHAKAHIDQNRQRYTTARQIPPAEQRTSS